MITVLENSLTRKKHTLNLVDHRGRVLGFNPYPNNKKVRWELTDSSKGPILNTDRVSIESYIIGAPFHFGSDVTFVPSEKDNSLTAVNIDLIRDDLKTVDRLTIYGEGGEYYVDDVGLSDEDMADLFSKESIERWKDGHWSYLYATKIKEKSWEEMDDSEKIAHLLARIEKLESKVNLLGNAR